MNLTLYYHPLASYCWKPLIALYEKNIEFKPFLVDLSDAKSREDFMKVWPMGQFPVLRDASRNATIPQSASIVEYLDLHYSGTKMLNPSVAFEARHWNSFYDSYVQTPMQKVVADTFRPEGRHDESGVTEARQGLQKAYGVLESVMATRTWAAGGEFSLGDCAAAPALFYADYIESLGKYPHLTAYLLRLRERPSFARVLREAEPHLPNFPFYRKKT